MMCLPRNDRAHAARWIGYVAGSAWYQVNMTMMDCLTRHCADVDADVESLDRVIGFDNVVAKLPQQFADTHQLSKVQVEIGRHVSKGQNQSMKRSHPVDVADCKYHLVSRYDKRRIDRAKRGRPSHLVAT